MRVMCGDILLRVCLAAAAVLGMASCEVHEYPHDGGQGGKAEFVLNLDYTDALKWGFHKEIDYGGAESKAPALLAAHAGGVDVRYTVKAYRVGADGSTAAVPDTVVTETSADTASLNRQVALRLEPGAYKFLVWTDYVEHGMTDDLCYDVSDFSEVAYCDRDGYRGNDDVRQCFRGERGAVVHGSGSDTATVVMERPMARYKFISTDLNEFLAMVVVRRAGKGAKTPSRSEMELAMSKINVADFKIRFSYAGFMPCSFNVWNNRPNDSWTGVAFDSWLVALSESETELGGDLVLVNGHESSVAVRVDVYDHDGTLLSSTDPINVPLMRNRLTVVRGHFLTSKASGGIGLVTRFDGEYDYEVP